MARTDSSETPQGLHDGKTRVDPVETALYPERPYSEAMSSETRKALAAEAEGG